MHVLEAQLSKYKGLYHDLKRKDNQENTCKKEKLKIDDHDSQQNVNSKQCRVDDDSNNNDMIVDCEL